MVWLRVTTARELAIMYSQHDDVPQKGMASYQLQQMENLQKMNLIKQVAINIPAWQLVHLFEKNQDTRYN